MYNAIKESQIQTSSCIKISNSYTEYFKVDIGVGQGDPILTTFFSIFINDAVVELNKLNICINIAGYMLRCLLYADDLVLIAETPNDIQLLIDILNTWANKWRLTINTKKSKIMHFRKKCKRLTEINFKMGDEILEKTSKYKYLGVMLDEFLKFDCALGAIISKYKLFKDMGFNTYTKLFNTGVIPILDSCAPVWSHIQFPKIEQVQHRALRVYMGVNRFAPLHGIYGDTGWLPTKHRRMIEVIRHWNRLIDMEDNRISKRIFLYDYRFNRKYTWNSFNAQVFNKLNLCNIYNNKEKYHLDMVKSKANF